MKRSEMLSKIASVIINYNEAHCIVNRDKAMEMAETILQVQEKNGMLPPLHIFKDQHEDYCSTYDDDECTCNPFRDNQWEPEDD